MSINRWARGKDSNHTSIVDALVACGCDVMVLDAFDLLVHRAGKLFPTLQFPGQCGLEKELRRTQFFFIRQRESMFGESGGVPAGLFDDAAVNSPQVRRHQQANDKHHQSEDDAK